MFWFCKNKKQKPKNSDVQLKLLKSTYNNYEYGIIKAVLEENKIPYIAKDAGAGSITRLHTGINTIDGTAFYVSDLNFLKAKELIDSIFSEYENIEEDS